MTRTTIVKECPKCKIEKRMTRHHVFPRRHFGNSREIFLLCRDCHDKLEHYCIPHELMPREFYPAALKMFLTYMEV